MSHYTIPVHHVISAFCFGVVSIAGSMARFAARRLRRVARFVSRSATVTYIRNRHSLRWRYFVNPVSARRFEAETIGLSPTQRAVLTALSTTGIAFTSVAALEIAPELWNAVSAVCDQFALEAQGFVNGLVNQYMATANQFDAAASHLNHNAVRATRFLNETDKAVTDDYLIKLHPPNPSIALDDPLLAFGLQPPVLDVVNSYLGMWSKLLYTDAWYQIAVDPGRRVGSQRWHRDPEDKQMVKVYLYISDVDEESGAMQYVLGSSNRLGEGCHDIAKWRAAGGRHYPPPGVVEDKIDRWRWVSLVGKRGSLIFCDTTGLHRGNIATKSSRVAATWTFVSPASLAPRRFRVEDGKGPGRLSGAARFALH